MMKKFNTIIVATILVLLIALLPDFTATAVAQGIPGFPGGEEGPPQIPIDGGLGVLVAAGGAYAIHKLRKGKKD